MYCVSDLEEFYETQEGLSDPLIMV